MHRLLMLILCLVCLIHYGSTQRRMIERGDISKLEDTARYGHRPLCWYKSVRYCPNIFAMGLVRKVCFRKTVQKCLTVD